MKWGCNILESRYSLRVIPTVPAILMVLILIGSFVPALGQDDLQASEPVISWGVETDVNSQYIWRGIVFEDHLVVQPSAWISAHGLTFSVWNNHVPANESGVAMGDEVDFAAAYEHTRGPLTSELGFAYYVYPDQLESPATGELSARLGVAYSLFEFSTCHTLDVVEYPNAYFGEIEASLETELRARVSGAVAAALGWGSPAFNLNYIGIEKGTMNVLSTRASVAYDLTDYLYLKPHLEYYYTLDSELADYVERSNVNVGTAIGLQW